MAEIEHKGGPYTKPEQDARRKEVARLHFEFGYSARKIADMMNINRNTIMADIKYHYDNIKDEIIQEKDDWVLQQKGRLEAQRSRVMQYILEGNGDKLKLEKLLLEIDDKLNPILLKIGSDETSDDIDEITIKEIVLYIIIKYSGVSTLTQQKIVSEIISMQQCSFEKGNKIFSKMCSLGLECSKKIKQDVVSYDLIEFALLRKYIVYDDKLFKIIYDLWSLDLQNLEKLELLDKRYQEKFGPKQRWSKDTFVQNDNDRLKIRNDQTRKRIEAISKAFDTYDEKTINKERFMEYVQCANVFFADETPMMEKMVDHP
ncbi:hypothetical protein C6988_05795 [Nitrosopumilus sp. b1]|uniref:hypothetical protein n=1 Tax=Nitrosopumilus sp. b1 TaxID=2109907 RepID=UPI0015F501F1|nr:hypothetical protein [Nitrosopumilus sp. b1]KAF6242702.1 hypothetical protein C6988_05795 [Nitrosopumilus sp. b1]